MRKLTILFAAFLSTSLLLGQGLNYKKVIAEQNLVDQEVFLSQLRQYQKENSAFSNAYYQIGKIELLSFSILDPIVYRVASRQYIYNAKTNFSLARNYVDRKEVTKNPEWYDMPDLKDKDSLYAMTVNSLDDSYRSTIAYADSYERLLFHYDNAVTNYLKARQDFININTSADNLRQLFLQTDDDLKLAIKEVGVSFDSSMFHLDKYRETYQSLPHIKKREVKVNHNFIDHFRMNGITPTNFLADEIDVWDYKDWSDRFLKLIEEEVDGLKDEIRNAYGFFTQTNSQLIGGEECIQATIDDRKFRRIINLVTKYDNKSTLIDIFGYLLAKLEYGNQVGFEKNCNPLDNFPTDDFISRKARIYQTLSGTFNYTDSLNNSIVSAGGLQQSFQWFFDEFMPNGSADFVKGQEEENARAFRSEVEEIRTLTSMQHFEVLASDQCYRLEEGTLSFEIGEDNEENFCLSRSMQLSDSLTLLFGKKGEEIKIIGAHQIGEDFTLRWEQPVPDSGISFFKIITDSSFVIGGQEKTSWLRHVSSSGAERSAFRLKSADTIIDVSYNDLQGAFTIVQANDTKHTLSTVSLAGKTLSSQSFDLPGKFLNVWRQEKAYWFFTVREEDQKSVVSALVLDLETNEFREEIKYACDYLLANPLLVKNDNESITLLSKNAANEQEAVYSLLDYNGNIKYEEIF